MSDDIELLKRRKLLELQRKLMLDKLRKEKIEQRVDPFELVKRHLVGRAPEILEKAIQQYPTITKHVVYELARLINEGVIKEIDGVTLYNIFEQLGCPVRLDTKIVFKSKGKVKTISEILREEES